MLQSGYLNVANFLSFDSIHENKIPAKISELTEQWNKRSLLVSAGRFWTYEGLFYVRSVVDLGDNCNQNFHLGSFIVRYTVGNLVLRRRYTSQNENFEYGYPHSNALFTFFSFKMTARMYFVAPVRPAAASCIKPLASCIYSLFSQFKTTLCNHVGFATVYRRIYCRKFMTLSNQTSRCIYKCIRINENSESKCIHLIYIWKDRVFIYT